MDDTRHIPLTPPSSDYFIPKIEVLYNVVFHALSGFDSRKAYDPDGVPPAVLKNCASERAPCLVKLFCLCLSTSTYSSCWKFAHIQLDLKKGDLSNLSNYYPIALIFCLSKAFESVFNKKGIEASISSSPSLSDCQYGFRKSRYLRIFCCPLASTFLM